MVSKVVMPRLSLTMKEGTVGKWYKKEGQSVEKGEPLVEVVSEKATYDLEAPASGILRKIVVSQGSDVPVDTILAFVGASDEPVPETEKAATTQPSEEVEERLLASPAAKRLAREHRIDLSLVKGTGPQGRIGEEDVERFAKNVSATMPKIKETIPLSGLRKTSAERLSMSFRTAPHSTIMMDVDISNVKTLHEKLKVSYTTIIVKATAKALSEHSIINSTLQDNEIKIYENINIGIATNTESGLVVPVLRNANEKSLAEIDKTIIELSDKAHNGRLAREDVTGGTFTITNLGMFDVDCFTPIINPPEAAILGVGKAVDKPVVLNGRIEVRPLITLSLSYDHRIVDGAPAAKFLQKVKKYLEKPETLET
jgi:pyruvate dehydrogenase E2 component (dihydrolipoamide acetyltransferase)